MSGDDIAGILAIFFIFGGPILAFVIMRVLAHRERIEMIKRGYIPNMGKRGFRGGYTPAPPPWGAPEAGPAPQAQAEYYDVPSAQRALRGGIITTFVGFAIFIGLSFIGYRPHEGVFGGPSLEPGPWLLGGLIPMFIGIAQIIIALLSGARFGIPVNPAAPPGAGHVGSSYYEPPHPQPRGANYEELKRPVPPPDFR
jgi:hypothetical protein